MLQNFKNIFGSYINRDKQPIIHVWEIIICFLLFQGALTHGDRRATESRDLSRFNIDNKVSTEILETVKIVNTLILF